MLMHHPYAEFQGSKGAADIHFFSLVKDLSALRLLLPEQHLHQGAFPCSVLADQPVDVPFTNRKINVLVCYKAVLIDLGDVLHGKDVFILFFHHSLLAVFSHYLDTDSFSLL